MTKYSKYKHLFFWAKTSLASLVLSAVIVPHASAHLMVAQHGTLNFKGDGVFMVLSLPVSAFENIDDDGDGKMSFDEFSKYRPAIVKAVNEKVKLTDKNGARPLQGLMLKPVVSHYVSHYMPKAPSKQLVIMGRFALAGTGPESVNELEFHVGLFGKQDDEKSFEIMATRQFSGEAEPRKYRFDLTTKHNVDRLFYPEGGQPQ